MSSGGSLDPILGTQSTAILEPGPHDAYFIIITIGVDSYQLQCRFFQAIPLGDCG